MAVIETSKPVKSAKPKSRAAQKKFPSAMAKSPDWPAFNVERRAISGLKPYANNARTHSEGQVAQIAASMKEWGWTNPVLIDEKGMILAGHGRLEAAKSLKIADIPCIVARGWSKAQKQAYILADNQLALNAGWNTDLLRVEIGALKALDFDIGLVGFGDDFMADLFKTSEGLTDPDEAPAPEAVAITQAGDVWVLGNHRLMCGDAVKREDVSKLLDGAKADVVYNDPPYGVSIVSGSSHKVGADKPFGKVGTIHRGMKAKPIVAANVYSEIIGDETTETAIKAFHLCASLKPKTMIFWGGNHYSSAALPDSSCWIVWDKENGESFFADAELAWTNQKTAVRIFKHKWNGLIKASERGEKRVHPTQKPVALAEWCFENYAKRLKTVLDLFGGSGSTLIACEKMKKQGFIMEMSPNYCDVIIKRWQAFTGKTAYRKSDGLSFADASK